MTSPTAVDMNLTALGAAVDAALTAPAAEPVTMPRAEPEPSVMEVITTAVEKVLTGNHKATIEKRKTLIATLAQGLVDLPVYGIELDNARVPIGEAIELGNALIEVDGYGNASRITVDGGAPIFDPA